MNTDRMFAALLTESGMKGSDYLAGENDTYILNSTKIKLFLCSSLE